MRKYTACLCYLFLVILLVHSLNIFAAGGSPVGDSSNLYLQSLQERYARDFKTKMWEKWRKRHVSFQNLKGNELADYYQKEVEYSSSVRGETIINSGLPVHIAEQIYDETLKKHLSDTAWWIQHLQAQSKAAKRKIEIAKMLNTPGISKEEEKRLKKEEKRLKDEIARLASEARELGAIR